MNSAPLVTKAATLKVAEIKEWLLANIANTAEEIELVFEGMLWALELKVGEVEFVEFCGQLEAAQ